MDKYYDEIKNLVENNLIEKKYHTYAAINHTLITYHSIGKILVEAQGGTKRAKYGENLIKKYSIKLTEEYDKAYSVRNLELMRQFYLLYPNANALRSQCLNWTHMKAILPFKNENKRNYYLNCISDYNLSSRALSDLIKSNAYERLINKDNIQLKFFDNNETEQISILDVIKDPILITINKSYDKITEKALKGNMIENIEKTILELGKGFCFAGSELPIKINGKIHRPDLVFFNTELNSYVIFELKLKELRKIDISQIEFYIRYYDDEIRKPFHNLTIGITVSKKIDKDMLKYIKKENITHTTYETITK